ncbi:MAG: hypothetical protein KAR19_01945 [Bacteroidales bacterium]|nr:hypothetical protein [Bacteroidales bacterium]
MARSLPGKLSTSRYLIPMLMAVLLGYQGFSFLKFKGKEHQLHLYAGLVILLAGVGIQFLGLSSRKNENSFLFQIT